MSSRAVFAKNPDQTERTNSELRRAERARSGPGHAVRPHTELGLTGLRYNEPGQLERPRRSQDAHNICSKLSNTQPNASCCIVWIFNLKRQFPDGVGADLEDGRTRQTDGVSCLVDGRSPGHYDKRSQQGTRQMNTSSKATLEHGFMGHSEIIWGHGPQRQP